MILGERTASRPCFKMTCCSMWRLSWKVMAEVAAISALLRGWKQPLLQSIKPVIKIARWLLFFLEAMITACSGALARLDRVPSRSTIAPKPQNNKSCRHIIRASSTMYESLESPQSTGNNEISWNWHGLDQTGRVVVVVGMALVNQAGSSES